VNAEPARTFEEVISPEEKRRLKDEAESLRRDAYRMVDQLGRRRLSATQQNELSRIRTFLKQSEEFQGRDDFRQARDLANRARTLAQGLVK
jgi:hypothetical protein